MDRRYLTLVVLMLVSTIIYASSLNSKTEPINLEFRVIDVKLPENYDRIAKKPPRQTDFTNVTIEYMIINLGNSTVKFDDIRIISYFGGFELGSEAVDGSFSVDPGESVSGSQIVREYWGEVLTIERFMDFFYGLDADAGSRTPSEPILLVSQVYVIKSEIIKASSGYLGDLAENVFSTGIPADSIPSIDNPKYISIDKVDFLTINERVYVVESEVPRIYPRRIMLWHEIVNDNIDGKEIAVTYCPLTETVIGYEKLKQDNSTTFGTSGSLLNSNLVFYDRETDSLWPQIHGTAVWGTQTGVELEWYPVVSTTWRKAIKVYPDALVLSTDTGNPRDYTYDPYRTYEARGRLMFPLMNRDDRLNGMDIVVGVKNNNMTIAIVKDHLRDVKEITFDLGGEALKAVYDEALDAVRVYNGDKLAQSFDVYWFGWYAYYPETGLISE